VTYPLSPGFKGRIETGRDGAEAFAPKLGARQREALDDLKAFGPSTAEEVAKRTDRHWYVVRPRLTELRLLGLVVDTGERRSTAFGGKTWVARVATPEEHALHLARAAADEEARA